MDDEYEVTRVNYYTNEAQNITYTAGDLWNRYTPDKRGYIEYFNHYEKYITDTTFPEVECALFQFVDRGIKSWKDFNRALKIWFPNLKTLLLSENYSVSEDEEFIEFFLDPWLEEIWIEDMQSSYEFIDKPLSLPKNKLRVFRQAPRNYSWLYDGEPHINYVERIPTEALFLHDYNALSNVSRPYIFIDRKLLQKN